MKTVTSNFLAEIERPSFYPIRRCYMLTDVNAEVEITDRVANFDRILWQIEQNFRINEFLASNTRIELKNLDEAFDIDNPTNFFVTELNRNQDGIRTPVQIKCGYVLPDGTEELIPVFYGLIIDMDISTSDDIIAIELQCVSRILRDTDTDNIGDQWTDQTLYGGDSHCRLNGAAAGDATDIDVDNNPSGNFSAGFPPTGYIKVDAHYTAKDDDDNDIIIHEEEIIYYGKIGANGFEGCLRGQLGTRGIHLHDNDEVTLLLADGSETNDVKFQFLVAPVSQDSISAISNSDGNIALVRERALLGIVGDDGPTTGWMDYESGVLELADEPSDSETVQATYKSVYRQLSYHALVKRLLDSASFSTSLVEDEVLYDYLGRNVPTTYGQISHAYSGATPTLLGLNNDINALLVGTDDSLYMGVANHIVQWDEEQFNLIASWADPAESILRLVMHSNGDIFGIVGDKFGYSNKKLFKWDGNVFTTLSTIAEYVDPRPVFGYWGGQWRNISIDETNGVIWFLYDDTVTRGLAKINFDGTGETKYSRPADIAAGPWLVAQFMDFVDIGDTIEFFYSDVVSKDLIYESFNKGTGLWTNIGVIGMPQQSLAPVDVVYHPIENRIYLNAVSTFGYLISVPASSNIKTIIETYDWYAIGHRGRICGMVYHDGNIWGIKGDENARGPEGTGAAGDSATGRMYRIANNTATDMGNMANYPKFTGFVKGSSAVMAWRASDEGLFFVSTDYEMQDNPEYGYQLMRYSPKLATVLQLVNLNGRKIWDILSELAVLVNFELGVSSDGDVFWRMRRDGVTYLDANINDLVVTIPTDATGMDKFSNSGMIIIDNEVISHSGKTANSFTGCIRGEKGSTANTHLGGAGILEIHQVIQNLSDEKSLKFAKKFPNWDNIYNHITVPYGNLNVQFNYVMAGQDWDDSSENRYGRKKLTISNQFLTSDDVFIATAIGWRYFDHYNQRASLLEMETKWQPQLDLGDTLSIKQSTRVLLDYVVARIQRIELQMSDFFVRIIAITRDKPYRDTIYDGYVYDAYIL